MKLHQLTEKTFVNQQTLVAIATEILAQATSYLPSGQISKLTYSFSDSLLRELQKNHGNAAVALIHYLETYVPVFLINDYSQKMGSYTHSSNGVSTRDEIQLFIPVIMKTPAQDHDGVNTRGFQNNRKIMSTLVHELRHVMQRQQFQQFYSAQNKTYANATSDEKRDAYSRDPIEIDAAFMHILYDNDGIEDPREFTNAVISALSEYKTLTPKQVEHYRRKAATFAYDRQAPADKPDSTINDRLVLRKDELLAIEKAEANAVITDSSDDLTQLSSIGMDGSKFNTSFPAGRFTNSTKGIINNGTENVDWFEQCTMYVGIINEWARQNGRKFDTSLFTRNAPDEDYIEGAIKLIRSHSFFDRFDRDLLVDWVNAIESSGK